MDVGEWLRSLGLSQYEALFRQNDIDAEVLSELTDGDLEKFGVSFGHRKRLLKAIASLAAADPVAKPAGPAPSQTALDAGERRQLTVMFCDLVGSTALAARLDPEDMSDIIRAFQGAVSAAAARFEGFVAKFMGDGALVYFGYPPGPRGRRRTGRARRGRARRGRAGVARRSRCCAGSAIWNRDWAGGRRRIDGRGRGARARRRRRDAESRGTIAGARRAGQHRRRGSDAAAARRDLRSESTGTAVFERLRCAGSRLDGASRGRAHQPLRGLAVGGDDAVRRSRAGGRTAIGTLARRGRGRGPGSSVVGRGRHRQVAHPGCVARKNRRRRACHNALSLLAALRQRCVLSDLWPNLACGGLHRRRAGGGANSTNWRR